MLNTVLVKFKDSKFNYKTNVSPSSTFNSCHEYFVGNTFFMGNCDTQESDPQMWQTCESIVFFKGEKQ